MTTCCGEPRDTPFCSTCGKRLQENHSLRILVVHCRRTAAAHQTASHNFREAIAHADNEVLRKRLQKRIAAEDALADKWTQWADGLEKLLNRESEPKK